MLGCHCFAWRGTLRMLGQRYANVENIGLNVQKTIFHLEFLAKRVP